MGKKKVEEMAEQRQIFIKGSEKRDVTVKTASYIFDLMEKFAGYGFNKSHSAAYAMIAYQTAYLKAHHTPFFLAAVMTAEIDNTDRLIMIREDCSNYQIDIVRPSINRSEYGFSVLSENEILYGLGAIKGVGKSTVESIIFERKDNGNYTSLNDFCQRLEKERINRRVLEALIKSGAMDDFDLFRSDLSSSLDDAIKTSDQSARDAAAGQEDMFGIAENNVKKDSKKRKTKEWDQLTVLKKEKESLGLYLSGHPFKFVKEHSNQFTNGSLKEICKKNPPSIEENQYQAKQTDVVVSGLISDIKKRGNRITVTLDDSSARMDVVFFKESYFKNKEFLRKDEIILVDGKLRFDQFSSSWQVNAEKVRMIDDVIEEKARILTIDLDENHNYLLIEKIKNALTASEQGECQVAINYENSSAIGRVELGDDWKILPTSKLRKDLEELIGKNSFNLSY
jgi:DNA polymerase-3 subunit alpha